MAKTKTCTYALDSLLRTACCGLFPSPSIGLPVQPLPERSWAVRKSFFPLPAGTLTPMLKAIQGLAPQIKVATARLYWA